MALFAAAARSRLRVARGKRAGAEARGSYHENRLLHDDLQVQLSP